MKTILNAIQARHDECTNIDLTKYKLGRLAEFRVVGQAAIKDRQALLDIIRDISELRTHVPPTAPMSVVWKSDIDLIINRTEP